MARSPDLHRQLCLAAPQDIRRLLDTAIVECSNDPSSLMQHILENTEPTADGLPLRVFETYLRTCSDPHVIVAALHQSHNTACRLVAIKNLNNRLGSVAEFRPTWDALGGPVGIATLMRALDLRCLARLCHVLGNSYRSPCARDDREKEMTQLLRLLCDINPQNPDGDGHGVKVDRDPRGPELRHFYEYLVKACTVDVCREWLATKPNSRFLIDTPEGIRSYDVHREAHREWLLQEVFKPDGRVVNLRLIKWPFPTDRVFSELVLRKLVSEDISGDWKIDAREFNVRVFTPLVNHLKKSGRHVPSSATGLHEFWQMIVTCLKKFPDLTKQFEWSSVYQHQPSYSILKHAIRWWHYTRINQRVHVDIAEVLQSLVGQVLTGRALSCEELPSWFRWARVPALDRFVLLRMFLQHERLWGFDLESSPSGVDNARLKGKMRVTVRILNMMPPETAVTLLNLALELHPDQDFSEPLWDDPRPSIFSKTKNYCPDTLIVRAYFQSRLSPKSTLRDTALNDEIETELARRKEKAQKYKPLGPRSEWVKSALCLSIAQGSVEGYAEMFLWASQFDHDGVTAKTTYSRQVLGTREAINLLSGVSPAERLGVRPFTPDQVRGNSEIGNRAVIKLLDAVSIASKLLSAMPLGNEFATDLTDRLAALSTVKTNLAYRSKSKVNKGKNGASSWEYVGLLPSDVVMQRMRQVNTFQSYWGLSDDEIYDLIWQPTLEMLLSAEEFAFKDDNKHLGYEWQDGMIRPPSSTLFQLRGLRKATWKFLDNLARGRDQLWRQKPTKQTAPSIYNLPPKGLPVQSLIPHLLRMVVDMPLRLPYIESRATDVLFSGDLSTFDLPIGGDLHDKFSDDIFECVKIFVYGEDPRAPNGINERIFWVWDYVVKQIGGSIFDGKERKELLEYWKDRLDSLFEGRGKSQRPQCTLPSDATP